MVQTLTKIPELTHQRDTVTDGEKDGLRGTRSGHAEGSRHLVPRKEEQRYRPLRFLQDPFSRLSLFVAAILLPTTCPFSLSETFSIH